MSGVGTCPVCEAANGCPSGATESPCWCEEAGLLGGPELAAAVSKAGSPLAMGANTSACLCPECFAGVTPSPCIRSCELDEASGLCVGCFRETSELLGWGGRSAVERAAVYHRIPARRAAFESRAARSDREQQ